MGNERREICEMTFLFLSWYLCKGGKGKWVCCVYCTILIPFVGLWWFVVHHIFVKWAAVQCIILAMGLGLCPLLVDFSKCGVSWYDFFNSDLNIRWMNLSFGFAHDASYTRKHVVMHLYNCPNAQGLWCFHNSQWRLSTLFTLKILKSSVLRDYIGTRIQVICLI